MYTTTTVQVVNLVTSSPHYFNKLTNLSKRTKSRGRLHVSYNQMYVHIARIWILRVHRVLHSLTPPVSFTLLYVQIPTLLNQQLDLRIRRRALERGIREVSLVCREIANLPLLHRMHRILRRKTEKLEIARAELRKISETLGMIQTATPIKTEV